MSEAKPFCISKKEVWEAYKRVKENKGAAGVDDQSIEDFEKRLKKNLYKIWNRMSSGSYFPPPVRTVKIPKKNGGERKLGIPTVADRIAQQVVKARLEPEVEPLFHADSYGYRPGKSALDAVGQARERCWRYDWVLDLDIKGFFDNLSQDLLLRAVKKHAKERWIVLYIERWLKAPVQEEDGRLVPREKGTPQGGVITPRTQKITSNLNARLGLSGGPGIADDTLSNLDVCLLRLYLYVICLAPVPLNGRNASIDPESCFSAVRHFPKRFNGSRRHVPCLPVRRIAISSRLSA
jgi:retron-type reverse transcriptase